MLDLWQNGRMGLAADQLAGGMRAAGVPAPLVPLMVSFDANTAQGSMEMVASDIMDLTGRAPQTLKDWFAHNKTMFGAPAKSPARPPARFAGVSRKREDGAPREIFPLVRETAAKLPEGESAEEPDGRRLRSGQRAMSRTAGWMLENQGPIAQAARAILSPGIR